MILLFKVSVSELEIIFPNVSIAILPFLSRENLFAIVTLGPLVTYDLQYQ